MIDWINDEAKHWARQMRIAHLGHDGWPPRSMLDKLIKEGIIGASAGRFMQYFPEVLDERAIAFNNLVKQLSENHRTRFFIHYVVVGKGKIKAHRMGEPRPTYYDRLDAAHKALASLGPRTIQNRQFRMAQSDPKNATFAVA